MSWRNWLYYGKLYYSSYFAVFNGHTIRLFWTSQIRSPTPAIKTQRASVWQCARRDGDFLAILLGTLGAGVIASAEGAKYIAAAGVVVFALLGYM